MATFRSDKDGPDKSRRYSKSGSHTKGMSEIRFGAQEKFVLAHKRNSFWRTRNWFVLRPFFLGLQYPQGEKSAHLGILNTEKYGICRHQ